MRPLTRLVGAVLVAIALLLAPAAALAHHSELAAQWPLDEATGGLTPDTSGHALDGTLGGYATLVPGGRFGNALDLLPPESYLYVADSPTLESPHITVQAWVRNAGNPGSYKWIVAKGAAGCSGASYGMSTGANGGLYFIIYDGTSAYGTADAGEAIWDGQWHAVAGTYDGANLRIYVDGAEVGTGTPNASTIQYGLQFEDFNLGSYPGIDVCGFDYMFPGEIDQVSIYRRALEAAELAELARGDEAAPPSLPTRPDPGVEPPPPPDLGPQPGRSLAPKVEGIEVTQAVQTFDQPRYSTYNGVALVKNKKTIVRVFADVTGPEAPGGPASRPPMGIALTGTSASGQAMPGGVLIPEWAPSTATLSRSDDFLTTPERDSPTSAFTFVLPDSWTQGSLNLEARAVGTGLCLREDCGGVPSRTLTGIVFRDPRPAAELSVLEEAVVNHVDLLNAEGKVIGPDPNGRVTGITVVKATPAQIFEKLRALSPIPYHFLDSAGRPADWPRFRATRLVSDTAILEPAQAFDEEIGRPGLATVGVYVAGNNPGITSGHTAVVSARQVGSEMWRPVTSVAHEIFHRHGFLHASDACDAGAIGVYSEPWPVRDGRMDSVGIDPTPGSGGASAPYRIIADTEAQGGYDLMSYCQIFSLDPLHWISARNWNSVQDLTPPRPSGRPWLRNTLVVGAALIGDDVRISTVRSAKGPPPADPAPSPYMLVARDAGGQALATVPLSQWVSIGAAGAEPVTVLQARVPSAGVTKVDIADAGGAVVASRTASAAAPRARIVSPGRGRRVGEADTVGVRWEASDADGDDLEVTLDYSSDGGRTFHNVWAGPSRGGSAQLQTQQLDATRNARLRLRVSDGFRETTTTSARFVVTPRGPQVQILEPGAGQRPNAGGDVRLRGAAVDDRGRRLTGRRLVWRAGRTVVGRGAIVSTALPAGTRRVTLEATDAAGRTGSDSVAVRVRATTPLFLRLAAAPLARGARTAVLIVAATQPSTLTVRGRRYDVGSKTRRIRVPVDGAQGTVRLRVTLTAGGRRTVDTVVVRRR
jgi:concanavalin A-like lectin/glucanase superfamily protein